jgi:hypothetical protein
LKLGDVESVREELKGNTGLYEDIEEKLIENVAQIELDAETIPGMKKGDWIGIGATTVVCIALFILCFTWV